MHINDSPRQASLLTKQLEMLPNGAGSSPQEQAKFCDHTNAVLRLIERVYVEELPPSLVVALSAMGNSLQAFAMTPLDPEHEDLSERLRPGYEKLFAVVRELQECLGINVDQMQREREEARWRDDQQHQEHNIDAQEANSKPTAAINTCVNSNTQNRVSNSGRSTLSIDTSLAARAMTRATVTSEHQPQASTSFAVPAEGPRPHSTSTSRIPGPSTNRDKQKKSVRELAFERRRTDPTPDRSLHKRNVKLWREKVEVPSGAQKTLDEARVEERPAPFKWVQGECIGQTEHGKLLLSLNATTGEVFAAKKCDRDKEERAPDYVRHLRALSRENEILKNLDHANIVQYLGFEEVPRYYAVFFEYVPGGPLSKILREHRTLDGEVIKFFLKEILGGLEYLRGKGIIHCNLTPENVLVEVNGVCKLSNFTEARHVNENIDFTGQRAPWRAPEIFSGARFDFSSDIWSVGCIAYEMLAGSCPWTDGDLEIQQVPPAVPTSVQLLPTAQDFLNECLAIDPHARPSASILRSRPYLELPSDWSFTGL